MPQPSGSGSWQTKKAGERRSENGFAPLFRSSLPQLEEKWREMPKALQQPDRHRSDGLRLGCSSGTSPLRQGLLEGDEDPLEPGVPLPGLLSFDCAAAGLPNGFTLADALVPGVPVDG